MMRLKTMAATQPNHRVETSSTPTVSHPGRCAATYSRVRSLSVPAFYRRFSSAVVCFGLLACCIAAHGQTPPAMPIPTAVLYNQQGWNLLAAHHYADAAAYLREAIVLDAKYAPAHRNLTQALYQLGQNDEAVKEGYIAIKLAPLDAQAYRYLGLALAAQGHYREAIQSGINAEKLLPSDATVAADLGRILSQAGRIKDAIAQYNYSLKLSPTYSVAHNGLGASYIVLGRYADAIKELRMAIRVAPAYGVAHLNLGFALYRTGNRPQARIEWTRAAKSGDVTVANLADQYLEQYP